MPARKLRQTDRSHPFMQATLLPLTTDFVGLLEAIRYAAVAHAEVDQVRAGSGEPYIVHPLDVVMLFSTFTRDAVALKAAALHDVLEDTNRTEKEVRDKFGDDVCDLVLEVTNPTHPEGLNRSQRKAIERELLSGASEMGQDLKCCDVACNIGTGDSNVARTRPKFASTYLHESLLKVEVLIKADPNIRDIALDRIHEGIAIMESIGLQWRPKGTPKP